MKTSANPSGSQNGVPQHHAGDTQASIDATVTDGSQQSHYAISAGITDGAWCVVSVVKMGY